MIKIKILLFLFLISLTIVAQDVDIPNSLALEKAEDYKNSEQLVINATDWLVSTPVSSKTNKRKELNVFLMQWFSGSPSVSIELVEGITPLDCPNCLMSFMSGWVKYSFQNEYSTDKIACAQAGVENAIDFYDRNKSTLGKNSDMEKLKKLHKRDKLTTYIRSKFGNQ